MSLKKGIKKINDEQIYVADVLAIILKRKWAILIITVLLTLGTFITICMKPDTYSVRAVIKLGLHFGYAIG